MIYKGVIIITIMELQNMRRTHYSSDLSSQDDGKSVIIMGWILTVRSHGNICFATVRDRDGDISIVAKKGDCSDSIRETLSGLKPHSSVGITGIIKASAKAPSGFEIIPTELRVFSKVEKIPPFSPMDKIVKNIETRLKVRSIDLRRAVLQNVFKLRSEILYDIRKYFHTEKFMEISTPKIISSSTEGGSSLFAIFYYNKEAFLAQSPQLYKEQLTMSFERVFEIGPIFRAEASRTNRHLAEAISIDLEEAFVDYNDIMTHIDNIIRSAVTTATVFNSEHKADFKIPAIPDKIPPPHIQGIA